MLAGMSGGVAIADACARFSELEVAISSRGTGAVRALIATQSHGADTSRAVRLIRKLAESGCFAARAGGGVTCVRSDAAQPRIQIAVMRARADKVAMRQMVRKTRGIDGYLHELGRVSRREVADRHLICAGHARRQSRQNDTHSSKIPP